MIWNCCDKTRASFQPQYLFGPFICNSNCWKHLISLRFFYDLLNMEKTKRTNYIRKSPSLLLFHCWMNFHCGWSNVPWPNRAITTVYMTNFRQINGSVIMAVCNKRKVIKSSVKFCRKNEHNNNKQTKHWDAQRVIEVARDRTSESEKKSRMKQTFRYCSH